MVEINGKRLVVLVAVIAVALVFYVSPVWAATGNTACCPDGGQIYANRLQVYVYDLDTNLPIKGATVSVTGPGSYKVTDFTGSRGSTGTFKGAAIAGAYTVSASFNGYDPNSVVIALENFSIFKCEPRVIRIGLGKSCDRWIKVCVQDKSTGQPVKDAAVCISGQGYQSCRNTRNDGCTEEFDGNFSDGSYTVSVSAVGYKSASKTATFSDDFCGQLDVSIDLPPCEPVIEVCVFEKGTNTPIEDASITLTGPGGYNEGPETAEDGCVEFKGELAAGSYTASATATGYKPGSATKSLAKNDCGGIEIRLELEPCEPVIEVCVYDQDTGKLIEDASVTLTGPGGYNEGPQTAEDGCVVFEGEFALGSYTATANAEGYYEGSAVKTLEKGICELLVRVELESICKPSISVYVFDEDTLKPVAGATVTLKGPDNYSASDLTLQLGWTEPFNSGLLPGLYTATATKSGYSAGTGSAELTEDVCGNLEIRIGIKKVPCEESRTLQIYVYDKSTGLALRGVAVNVTGPGSYSFDGVTDNNGRLILSGPLYDGVYKATVGAFTAGDYYYKSASGSVSFSPGVCGKREIKIGLESDCIPTVCRNTFQVYVYEDDGGNTAVQGVLVQITGPGQYAKSDVTGSKGRTVVLGGANLAGTYTISATKSGYEPRTVSVSECGDHVLVLRLAKIIN
ncbi:MAG: Alpha-2-macroglobulin MG1 domain protein [Pelotomaculum sp. PtaB.Bin104]|nr:MAG: Alpha-2-macroglobulin MG1 domain protein [Pelotomaculum sp. PtaB.Bin104]